MDNVRNVMGVVFATGSIPAGTQSIQFMNQAPLPATATLSSTAGGRLIEISSDGINYGTPALDFNQTGFISVAITAPVSHVRFTGAAGDLWNVR